jgi:outer membrane receptor protein involved in Fe transport
MRLKISLTTLLILTLVTLPAVAQEQRGAIQGVVVDETGAVLPGATVEARSPRMPGVETAVTNERGAYRFPALPPGDYELTATMPGFNNSVVSNVTLSLGQLLTIDIVMSLAGMSETVTVTGESPLIDTKQSASFANIDTELIDRLPKDRDFTALVTIAPGANQEEKAAGISIDGAAASENRYIIDGIDTTDLFDGRPAKQMITDHLDEVQVKSSGYNAEYGGATGGVINVITKSGTNSFRGSVIAYFLHDALIADPRESLRLSPESDDVAEYIQYDEDSYRRIEPGFTLGGPIVSDRAWFFASYIPTFEKTSRDINFLTGNVSGTYTSTERVNYFTANASAQISDGVRGRFSATFNPKSIRGQLPNLAGDQDPNSDFAALGEDRPNRSIAANVDWTPTESTYVNVRGGHFSYDLNELGRPEEIYYRMYGSNGTAYPETPAELQRPNGWTSIPSNRAYIYNSLSRWQLHSDVTYYTEAAGQHTFKAGFQFDRPQNDVFRENLAPEIRLYWDRTRTTTTQERVRGTYGYYLARQRQTTGDIYSNDMAFFFQDSWTIGERLTLNLGIRTESQTIPSYTPEGEDIKFGFGDRLSPRLGFAYDMNGKTKFYGSFGNFYDSMKLNLPRGLFGGEKSKTYVFGLETLDWSTLGADGCVPPSTVDKVENPTCPGAFLDYYDSRFPSNDPNNPLLDPDIKPMESREWTFGFEHELTPRSSVGIRYVHKELVRTIEDVGRIVPGFGEQYYIANPGFGLAEFTVGPEYPAQPKAQRDYDGLEFRFRRRFADRWAINTSYLWSRLYGNYAGLSNSDEIQTSEGGARPQGEGRSSPNTNRVFDNIAMAFDQNAQPVIGRLGTDRPHQFKVQGSYSLDFGLNFGLAGFVASGTPISREGTVRRVSNFYLGRLSDGRTPVYSNFNLLINQRIPLGRGNLELRLNITNLFNQKTVTHVWVREQQDDIAMDLDTFFAGFDVQQLIEEQGIKRDPRFLQNNFFQRPREIRIGIAYQF